MLEEKVRQYREKIAVTLGDYLFLYDELDKDSNKIANALVKTG